MSIHQVLHGQPRNRRAVITEPVDPASPWGDVVELLILLPLTALVVGETLWRLL